MNDMISRAAAVRALASSNGDYLDALERLERLPAVDAAPVVHARPVQINPLDPEAKICIWKCSSLCSICGDYVAVSWKYCPNCGARMDGERRDGE